uniref:LRR n=1 Tax=Oryza brachyantha TaxID=4533 RepID=A0A0U1X1F3_ORYBR|nr:LRR [Oryza brachyantha]
MVDIASFGFPLNDRFNPIDNRMLWTFRGRLRLNPNITQRVDSSHLFLYNLYYLSGDTWKGLLAREATEITRYSPQLLRLDGTIVADCCMYLLSLNYQGGDIMGYNWATHAYNCWVCDGIINVQEEEEQQDQAWKVAAALHQEIRLEDYSSNTVLDFGDILDTPQNHWIMVTDDGKRNNSTRNTISLFIAFKTVKSLPNYLFHEANNLHILRLCNCTFNFSSPPFNCCHSLRFLGLNKCKALLQEARQDKNNTSLALAIFQRLWVLDVCYTDCELVFPQESTEEQQMALSIREVHINKEKISHNNFAWQRLKNIRKLRVIEPTQPWGKIEEIYEFAHMLKLELLDLSRNNLIQVLPSLSGAANLKTLILDGCLGLEQVGPQGLPPSLSFDSGAGDKAKISSISLAGCSRLVSFTLRGPLPNLKDLDLSRTILKRLDLRDLQAPCIECIILLGCEKLYAILWPEERLPNLRVLHIDTFACHVETEHRQTYAVAMDIRSVQSLVLTSNASFCWSFDKIHLNFCSSSTPKDIALKKERKLGSLQHTKSSWTPSTQVYSRND